MAKIAQILTQESNIWHGKDVYAGTSGSLEPGMLVQLSTGGSTVNLASAATVFGIAWGVRQTYRPTTQVFATGEAMTVVYGTGEIQLSADFFSGGALPTALDLLYSAPNGLWSTSSGGTLVGQCIKNFQTVQPTGGTGTAQNTVLVRFNIQP